MNFDDELITSMHPPGSFGDIRYFPTPPERELHRPKINLFSTVGFIVAFAIAVIVAFCVAFLCTEPYELSLSATEIGGVSCGVTAAILVFLTRKAVPIWCVRMYQRFAPDEVRLRCLYTPSCSEYMIVGILKYGFIRGIAKGIKRLGRCHHPNGGEDLP